MGTDDQNTFTEKIKRKLRLDRLPPTVRRVLVGIIGTVVLIVGVAMIFLPGPAFVMVPLGLAILSTEFIWARRWLNKAKTWIKSKSRSFRHKRAST